MLDDPGFLSLFLIFVFWVVIIFLGLLIFLFPRKWRQKGHTKEAQIRDTHQA